MSLSFPTLAMFKQHEHIKKKHLPLEIKYGGIYAKELKRVKELEHENYKLKKMYA